MKKNIQIFVEDCIQWCQRYAINMARFALFLVYAWFGALKIIGMSPANPLVGALLAKTMPFFPFEIFIVLFGFFEVGIGIMFLMPKLDLITIPVFAAHMVMTFLPFLILPSITWTDMMVPTLEGQYILKNVVLIALVMMILSNMKLHLKLHKKKSRS